MSDNWSSRYLCFVCQKQGKRTHATIRVFSGVGMGAGLAGGWPACEEHTIEAEHAGLKGLNHPLAAKGYIVEGYAVKVDKYGYPGLGEKLWTANRVKKDSNGTDP